MLAVQAEDHGDCDQLHRDGERCDTPVSRAELGDHIRANQTFVDKEVPHDCQRNEWADQSVGTDRSLFTEEEVFPLALRF